MSGVVKRARGLDAERIIDAVLVAATVIISKFAARGLLEAMNAAVARLGGICAGGEGCGIVANPPLASFEIEVLSWVVAVAATAIFIILMEVADRERWLFSGLQLNATAAIWRRGYG